MKKIFTGLLILLLLLPTVAQQDDDALPPEPVRIVDGSFSSLSLYFSAIKQGRVGLIHIQGETITDVFGDIFDEPLSFFTIPGHDGQYALIPVSIEQAPRGYELSVTAMNGPETGEEYSVQVNVESGGFIRQDVILIGDAAELVNPDVEAEELALLFELATPSDEMPLWIQTGFQSPLNAPLTSPFGAVRVFNGAFTTLHTGWDFQAQIGQPVMSSATGDVVFAGRIPIRGNYVMIHHGQGVYSGYAHLSVVHVTQGQRVYAGQVIGQVGSTGRSSSAHAHVEFIAGGLWVDAADFIRMYLPK